jgi:peptide/nickel transport system substrate-binding protein
MYTNSSTSPFPILWFHRFLSTQIAQKSNGWSLSNFARINSPDFDKLYNEVQQEMDPTKSTPLFQQMMHLIWDQVFELGLISRQSVAAVSSKLQGQKTSQWTYDTYDTKDWSMSS